MHGWLVPSRQTVHGCEPSSSRRRLLVVVVVMVVVLLLLPPPPPLRHWAPVLLLLPPSAPAGPPKRTPTDVDPAAPPLLPMAATRAPHTRLLVSAIRHHCRRSPQCVCVSSEGAGPRPRAPRLQDRGGPGHGLLRLLRTSRSGQDVPRCVFAQADSRSCIREMGGAPRNPATRNHFWC